MIDHTFRARLARLAGVMLPGDATMPSAAAVAFDDDVELDTVLAARPDLVGALERAVRELDDGTFDLDRLAAFLSRDPEAYGALTTVVAAAYYLCPQVRIRIGYPGQEPRTYDPFAYVDWVAEGLLDLVLARGPRWRDPDARPVPEAQ